MAGARQPIALLEAKGKKHLTKEEIKRRKESEVKANDDNIKPPAYLSAQQKKEFLKYAEELVSIKIMTNLDCEILARFVVASELYGIFTMKLFDPEIIDDIYEVTQIAKLQDQYFKQSLSASKELGLTISSRCKLVVPKQNEEKNPLLEALKDGSD